MSLGWAARRERARGSILLLLLLCAPIVLYRLGRPGLSDPDEGRNAEVAREMLATGDFVTPHIDGARYLDKPPAFFWVVAASYTLLGVDELAARLPSALFALAGIALTAWFARRHGGARAGMAAGAVLALSPLCMIFGRLVIFDMMLIFFMTAAAMAAFEAMEGDGARARLAGAVFFSAAGIGTITKGPVALLVPLLVAVAWSLVRRRPGLLRRLGFGTGLAIYAAIVLPWLALVAARNPGYLEYAILGENLGRIVSNRFQTARPWHFYLTVILPGLFPWIVFALVAWARQARRARREGLRRSLGEVLNETVPVRRAALFAAVWFWVIYGFFSLVASKRPSYMLPCAAPIALATGLLWAAALGGTPQQRERGDEAASDLAAGAVAVAAIGLLLALGVALVPHLPALTAAGTASGASRFEFVRQRAPLLHRTAAGLALVSGLLLATARARRGTRRRPGLAFAAAALMVAVLVPLSRAAFGYVEASRSARPVSAFLATRLGPDDVVICFDQYRPGLNFYLRRPIDLVIDTSGPGVLFSSNYIKQHLKEYLGDPAFRLMSDERLREALGRGAPRAFVLAPRKQYEALRARAGVPLEAIYEDDVGAVFVRAGSIP
ncbi:MAG: hypothetical protein DMF50_04080 [Acidobacteria bacterium]|nr:MAG: hypothetical protein DMF50_04080 [Acidobacteriota bacterium]